MPTATPSWPSSRTPAGWTSSTLKLRPTCWEPRVRPSSPTSAKSWEWSSTRAQPTVSRSTRKAWPTSSATSSALTRNNGTMRLGVLDIGSNTVHLLLVDAHPGARPVPFASHKRPLSLVQYLDPDGNITDAGQHELTEFVLEAWEFAAKHKADDLLAFCTSAIREATNGPSVLARVKHETTVTLQELTGSEEASMTFFAVRRWYGWGAGPILNLDIGGGSFEMATGQDELPELATSVPLGASRLTRDWMDEDPPTARSVKELRRYI